MKKSDLFFIAAMLTPLSANATLSWSFTGSGQNYGSQHTFSGSSGAGSVSVSAFSTTLDSSGDKFETGTLGSWSGGIGVQSQEDGSFGSSPHHAFDNDGGANTTSDEGPGGDVDAAIFAFDQSVSLTSLSIGWDGTNPDYDADISVLAYTGSGGPASILGKTFTQLLSSGWQLIGNYSELDHPSNPTASINASNVSSSYWLVSAYTSCANANSSNSYVCVPDSNGSLDFGDDFFKISGLTGTVGGGSGNTGSVPEPSSLLLFTGGLLGWRLNRYSKAQAESNEALAA
ncbi:hypothetical protein A1359_01110 [Methylomonas lenta]|uniref:Ice-binding protein C-terminal domain-containing protein n=1 Tax=Methylomonas lenta TaxID=980561 RepID=A0A177N827_9GAMM|nr:exosortase-dependent surface protein XDP1 [Methylomonas lenta]OAI14035.1 hypothetical protein A1359_01110 [Methylomonas lenta]